MFLSIFETDVNGNKNKIKETDFISLYGEAVILGLKEKFASDQRYEIVSIDCDPSNYDSLSCQFDIIHFFSNTNILYVEFIGTAK